jgi:hypothetical protein
MGRLMRAAAALAVGAAPVLGVVAAQPGSVLAGNGVIKIETVHGSGMTHLLAQDGVIHNQSVRGPGTVHILADGGVINSKN